MGLRQAKTDDVHDEDAQQRKAPHDVQLVDACCHRHLSFESEVNAAWAASKPDSTAPGTTIWRCMSKISPGSAQLWRCSCHPF